MKKILFSIISVVSACAFFACNKDYNANTASPTNLSINPYNTLDSAGFNWTGTDAISAYVDGTFFNVDSTKVTYDFVGGVNVIKGYLSVGHGFEIRLADVYGNNIYDMGPQIYLRHVIYEDSIATGVRNFYSYFGNVGQVQIIRNDPQRIVGRFHFQGNTALVGGTVNNVGQGWFSVRKY